MKTVTTQFTPGGRCYDYLVQPGDTPAVGDFVITSFNEEPTKYGSANHGPNSALIVSINDNLGKATKPYLLLVPKSQLQARKKASEALINQLAERKAAKARLEALLKEQCEMDRYATLAASNPEAAALLETLRSPLMGA